MKLIIKNHNLRRSISVGDTYVVGGGTLELTVNEVPRNVHDAVLAGQISYKIIKDEPKLVKKSSRRRKSSTEPIKFTEGDGNLDA